MCESVCVCVSKGGRKGKRERQPQKTDKKEISSSVMQVFTCDIFWLLLALRSFKLQYVTSANELTG